MIKGLMSKVRGTLQVSTAAKSVAEYQLSFLYAVRGYRAFPSLDM